MKYFGHTLVLAAFLAGAPVLATAAPARAAQAESASDAAITAKVKSQIDATADFKESQIQVATENGVVTLTGVAASPLVRAKAGELTKATDGVAKVNNKLTLKK